MTAVVKRLQLGFQNCAKQITIKTDTMTIIIVKCILLIFVHSYKICYIKTSTLNSNLQRLLGISLNLKL